MEMTGRARYTSKLTNYLAQANQAVQQMAALCASLTSQGFIEAAPGEWVRPEERDHGN